MPAPASTGISLDLTTTQHIERTDPAAPTIKLTDWLNIQTDATYINESLNHVLALTTQHWSTTAIPTAGLQACLNTLACFFQGLLEHDTTTLDDITDTHIQEFIDNAPQIPAPNPPIANPVRHLRRNVLAALSTTAQAYGRAPLPVPTLAAAKAGNQRPGTHDEILLLRLTADLTRSQRATGLAAAVTAALTSGATPNEAASLNPEDLGRPELALPGRKAATPGAVVLPRRVSLDAWANRTLDLYLEHGYDGHSPYALYSGQQSTLSNSAQASISNQLKKVAEQAGIHHHGVTPTSVRMWAALRDNTDSSAFGHAAHLYGTDWTTLHHHVFRTSDRRYKAHAA